MKQLTTGTITTNGLSESDLQHLKAFVSATKQPNMVMVDNGALNMVINALTRDAEEGKAVRAEMVDALRKTMTQVPTIGFSMRHSYDLNTETPFEQIRKGYRSVTKTTQENESFRVSTAYVVLRRHGVDNFIEEDYYHFGAYLAHIFEDGYVFIKPSVNKMALEKALKTTVDEIRQKEANAEAAKPDTSTRN